MMRMLTEGLLLAVVAWQVRGGVAAAVTETLATAGLRRGEVVRAPSQYADQSNLAFLAWLIGLAALFLARHWAHRRSDRVIEAPFLTPALAVATGIGLVCLVGYGDPLHDGLARAGMGPGWPGLGFGLGVGAAGVVAALLVLMPWDPGEGVERLWPVLAIVTVAIFVALRIFGEGGQHGHGPWINLEVTGGMAIQPIELAKLTFVGAAAGYLARQAGRLRYHRHHVLGVKVPRVELLVPVLALLFAVLALLKVVGDLGPVLVLLPIVVALTWMTTRATLEVGLVLALAAGAAALLLDNPEWLPDHVQLRLTMLHDPWTNGVAQGDQLAESLWAFAAGGFGGQGAGGAHVSVVTTAIAAGHTDLALAHVAESVGWVGLTAYHVALAVLVGHGFWIAARNRSRARMLLAAGLSTLLLAQWFVIFAGTVGWLPLTGIVVPFLSAGKTSMVVFVAAVGVPARLAVDGRPTAAEDALDQLRPGAHYLGLAGLVVIAFAGLTSFSLATVDRDATTLRAVKTRDGEGNPRVRHNPRLTDLAARLPRGPILDRHGEPVALTDAEGVRRYPLGDALGVLMGWVDLHHSTKRRFEAMERAFSAHLRGLDDGAGKVDYARLLPLVDLSPAERRARLQAMIDDPTDRTVHTTLDAGLQRDAYALLKTAIDAHDHAPAAAAAVVDADTGEVLVRVQYPDFDPNGFDPLAERPASFGGVYGPGRDKTGVQGNYQAGSVAKVATALAAVRAGAAITGAGCDATTVETHPCTKKDAQGPYFTRPSWKKPIHDGHAAMDGNVDLAKGLEVSCNVYFGQLGLALGPQPLLDLRAAGVEMGRHAEHHPWHPGAPETRDLAQTAYGQGTATLHVVGAARLAAAVAGAGVYRRCSPHLQKGECDAVRLVEDPDRLAPILAGMYRVTNRKAGTAYKWVAKLPGLRLYGKTGTATDLPLRDTEKPYVTQGDTHAWFIGFAEPDTAPACGVYVPGRLAVSVVVVRGGGGGKVAAPIAADLLKAAQQRGYLQAR